MVGLGVPIFRVFTVDPDHKASLRAVRFDTGNGRKCLIKTECLFNMDQYTLITRALDS